MTFVYLLSQAHDIALLSQNPRACHVAADMAEKTSQNKIWPTKGHVAHGPQIVFGLLLAGPLFHFFGPYFFYACSPYNFSSPYTSAHIS